MKTILLITFLLAGVTVGEASPRFGLISRKQNVVGKIVRLKGANDTACLR